MTSSSTASTPYLSNLTSWSSDDWLSSFRIMKCFFFPSLLYLIFSSATAVTEEAVMTALAAEAAVVGRASSSVGSTAGKPITLIMLGKLA